MTIMQKYVAINGSKVWRQMGNHLFVINADLCTVYEGVSYDRFAMDTVKETGKTYIVTKDDTWNTLADRFFGTPVAPNFKKAAA